MNLSDLQRKHREPVKARPQRGRWLGYLAAIVSRPSRRRRLPVRSADLKRHDWTLSTQRLGARFSERIRAVFRYRWLRKVD